MTNKASRPKHYIGATKRRSSPKVTKGFSKFVPPITNWGSFTIGLLIGGLLTTITIFTIFPYNTKHNLIASEPTTNTNKKIEVATKKKENAKPEITIVAAEHIKEPRFEFYTELTEDSHGANKSKASGSSTLDLKSEPKPINRYLVQAGSFKRRADADALKARLTLNGLSAKIELVKLNENEYWHRVLLGPFQSEAQATEQKHLLNTLEVDSILVLKSSDN